jgi:glycosyltransferase involved in cell wall biosynthesis
MLVGTHSNQTTGYSKVTHHMITELAKYPELDIYHFAFQNFVKVQQSNRIPPSNVNVFDPFPHETNKEEQGFGFSQLPAYIQQVRPDFIMIYNDTSIIHRFLDEIDKVLTPEEKTKYKMIIYLDQVYILQKPDYLQRIDKAADIYFAFTDYWRTILRDQGIQKPIHVLRHGFDPAVFKPIDRQEARTRHNIPHNMFLLLNLNRNTPRKHHDIVVQAFAELVARHPTKPMGLLVTCDGGQQGGYPIVEIFQRELLQRGLQLQYHQHKLMMATNPMTWDDSIINDLYAMSDIGITGADGEGFGLCQFEAMGIGIPQVVPYIGGFRDFCIPNETALCVQPKLSVYLPLSQSVIGGKVEIIDYKDLALAAEDYLMDSDMRERHGKAAMEKVLTYTWANEVKTLVDVLLGSVNPSQ